MAAKAIARLTAISVRGRRGGTMAWEKYAEYLEHEIGNQ